MLHDTALPVLALPAHRVAGWVEPRPATRSGMIGCQLH